MKIRIRLAQKIFSGYIAIILLTSLIGIYSVINLYYISNLLGSTVEVDFPLVRLCSDLFNTLNIQFGNDRKFTILREKEFLRLFDEENIRFKKILNDIRNMDIERGQSGDIKKIETLHAGYSGLLHKRADDIL